MDTGHVSNAIPLDVRANDPHVFAPGSIAKTRPAGQRWATRSVKSPMFAPTSSTTASSVNATWPAPKIRIEEARLVDDSEIAGVWPEVESEAVPQFEDDTKAQLRGAAAPTSWVHTRGGDEIPHSMTPPRSERRPDPRESPHAACVASENTSSNAPACVSNSVSVASALAP